ncbi:MAG TPA: ABC transporter substrate-binding protein [Solirubrobacteraceae bacterium]|nr:ABC transporter substrate-binding protein [Solirubrobacteraceae bacterium]
MTRRTSLAAIAATLIAAGSLALAVLPGAAAIAATACTNGSLSLVHKGQLTVATDAPAYPPYFENNKPANGQGFESAIAYGVGHELGFSSSQVKWTVEPFDDSYAPGPKSFDFDINEISITTARAKAVDFSTSYFDNPQAIVVVKGSKYQHVTSLAQLRGALFGVQVGTTSLSAVTAEIHPTQQPQVFNGSNDVITALRQHKVDAIVVDLATGFYLTSGEIPHGIVVGQFNAPGGDNWGLLLAKHSKLTPCVDDALAKLRSSGELSAITKRWMQSGAGVPVLK